MKPTVTYKSTKTKEMANTACNKYMRIIINSDTLDIGTLKKLCGSMCYRAVYLIPDYELIDDKVYTIENICYHVTGITTLSLHDILECFARISIGGTDSSVELCKVLGDCLFPEAMYLLDISTKDIYAALLITYLHYVDPIRISKVRMMWQQPSCSVHTLSSYFESEVHKKWKI